MKSAAKRKRSTARSMKLNSTRTTSSKSIRTRLKCKKSNKNLNWPEYKTNSSSFFKKKQDLWTLLSTGSQTKLSNNDLTLQISTTKSWIKLKTSVPSTLASMKSICSISRIWSRHLRSAKKNGWTNWSDLRNLTRQDSSLLILESKRGRYYARKTFNSWETQQRSLSTQMSSNK